MGTPLLRRLAKATFALFLALTLGAGAVQAQNIFVSSNGNDLNDGLAVDRPKRTIQAGINAASAGQNVAVAAGFYDESVTVNKRLTLSFSNADGNNPVRINNLTLATSTGTATNNRSSLFLGAAQPLIVLSNVTVSSGHYAVDANLQLAANGTINWNASGTDRRFDTTTGGGTAATLNTLGAYDLTFGNSGALTFNDNFPDATPAAGNLDDVTLAGSATVTINLGNAGNADDVTVNAGATLNVSANTTIGDLFNSGTVTDAGAFVLTINGNLVNNGVLAGNTNITLTGGGGAGTATTISGTGTFGSGTFTMGGGFVNTSNEITVTNINSGTGTFNVTGGAVNVTGVFTFGGGNLTDNATGHIKMIGNAASRIQMGGAPRTFGNLTVNRGVANFLIVDAQGGNQALTVGNLIFPAGRMLLGANNGATPPVGTGDVSLVLNGTGNIGGIISPDNTNATGALTVTNASGSTKTIAGSGQIFLDITKTGADAVVFSDLSRTQALTVNAGRLEFDGNVQVGEAAFLAGVTVNGGEIQFDGTATVFGNVTNNAGGAIDAAQNVTVNGNFTNMAGAGTVDFDQNLTVTGAVDNDSNLNIDGSLSAASVDNAAGQTLTVDVNSNVSGNTVNAGTLDLKGTGSFGGTVTNNAGTLNLPSGTISGAVTAVGGTINVAGGTFGSTIALNGGNINFTSAANGGLRMSTVQGNITRTAGGITVQGTDANNNHTLVVQGTLQANTAALQNFAGFTTSQDLNINDVAGLGNNGVRLKFTGTSERTFTVGGAQTVPSLEVDNSGGLEIAGVAGSLTVSGTLLLTNGLVASDNGLAGNNINVAGALVRIVEGRLEASNPTSGDPISLAGAPTRIEFANTSDITAGGNYLGTVGNGTAIEIEGSANATFSAGPLTIQRLTLNSGLTLTNGSTLTTVGGGGAGTLALNGTYTGTINFQPAASASITGAGSATTINITAPVGVAATLSGTNTIGTLTTTTTGGGTINMNGGLTLATGTFNGGTAQPGTVNFNANGPGMFSGAVAFNGPAVNLNRTVMVMGNLTIGAGSGQIRHGVGDFDLTAKGATVTMNAADVFAYDGSGRLTLEGSAAQALVLGTNVNVARMEVNNAAGVTLNSSGRFLTTTNLLLTAGTFAHSGFLQARGPLNQSGRITVIAGNLSGTIPDGVTPSQLFFQNTSSITALDELSGNLQDVTMAGAAGTTVTSQNGFNVAGVLLLESGNLASGSGNTVSMQNGSQLSRAAGTFSGSIAYPTGGSSTNFRFVNSGDITTGDELAGSGNIANFLLEGAGKVTLAHSPSVTTLTVSSGTLDVADQNISVSGNATNNGAMMGTTGSLRMVGSANTAITGGGTAYPNIEIAKTQAGAVFGTVTQSKTGNAATVSMGNFTQTSGNYTLNPANINILQVNGDLNITSGARQFVDGNGTVGVTGNVMALATATGAGLTLGGTVRMNGSSPQMITMRQAAGFNFATLRIDNATTLASNANATTLNLNTGILTTGSNTMTVTGTAVGNLVRGSGMVNGTLARGIAPNNAATYNFPMSDGTNFRQLGFLPLAGSYNAAAVVTVSHIDQAPNGTNGLPFSVGNVTVNNLAPMQWTVTTSVAPAAGAAPQVQLFAQGLSGVGEVEKLRMTIRGGNNEAGNPWTAAGTHVGSLFSGGVPSTIMSGIGGWAITNTQQLTIGGDRADNALAALKAPTLQTTTPSGALTVAEGATLEVNYAFDPQDADEQIPTAELVGAPDFVSVEIVNSTPVQNLVNVKVTAAPGLEDSQANPYTFQLKVTDAGGLSATVDVSLTVTNTSQPPVFSQATTEWTVTLGTTVSETIAVSDPDGDPFTLALGAGAPAGASLDNLTLTYTASEVGSVTIPLVASDATGSTSLSLVVNTFVYGDPSGDAGLSTTDAAAILAHVSGSAPFTGAAALAAADVSGNGQITPFDAALVLQRLVGLIDCFPAETGCAGKNGAISATNGSLNWANLRTSDEPGLMEVDLVAQGGNILAATLSAYFGEGVEVVGFEAANGEMLATHTVEEDGMLKVTLAGVAPMGETVAKAIVRLPETAEAALSVESEVALNEEPAYSATEEVSALPEDFVLHANYPNPFNPTTTIAYELPNAVDVKVQVFNALGQMVRTLVNSEQKAGKYNVQWDSRSDAGSVVASGVYIYRIQAGSFVATKKMLLVK